MSVNNLLESVPPSMLPSENHRSAPVYLYDSKPRKYSQSIQKLDSNSIIDEDDLFHPIIAVSWDTSIFDVLNRIPYGVFIQHTISFYEKGILSEEKFITILISQLTYFFKGLRNYIFKNQWNKNRVKEYITELLDSIHLTLVSNTKIASEIVF